MPAIKELLTYLDYFPDTGGLYWRPRNVEHFATRRAGGIWNARFAGKVAGSIRSPGSYRTLNFQGVSIPAARLVWEMHTGHRPTDYERIVYLNGKHDDLRACNLILRPYGVPAC